MSVENRSRYTVSVKHRPDLPVNSPHDRHVAAREYLTSLPRRGVPNRSSLKLRTNCGSAFARSGHKELCFPASSYGEAEGPDREEPSGGAQAGPLH